MSWFGDKASGEPKPPLVNRATSQARMPLGEQRVVPSTAPAGGLTLMPNQGTHRIITTLADFPMREDVLSGINASAPGLRVPVAVQDYVLVVKVDAMRAVLVYDPSYTQIVKSYFATLRSAVLEQGLRMDADAILANSSVLRDVRMAAESKKTHASGMGAATSGGAKLFREWVKAANNNGATDLHMQIIDGGRAKVLCRVDGELEPIDFDSKGIFTDRDVLNAMKAGFEDMAEQHSNNDGTFSGSKGMSCMIDSRLGIPNIRLRFSSQKGFFGPKAVSRILHSELNLPPMSFESMGLANSHIDLLNQAQRLEAGAVLQVGVTGSGKTTVAKTFIETHPKNGEAAFYGIADPIEYLLKNTHQIYIQRDLLTLETAGQKDPYSEAIEQLMRMDPDLIDVGEVRDQLSARALANVANSGHVAMGTLHAPSIGGAINRLSDPKMGLTRQELTSGKMLGFISYKALLPALCECAVDLATAEHWHRANNEDRHAVYLGTLMTELRTKYALGKGGFKFKNKEGCSKCNGRGTKGLTMVAEMMMPDDEWLDIAAKGNDRAAMRYWRQTYSDKRIDSPDMSGKLVSEHTIYKAILGRVDPRTIERFGPLKQLEVLT